MKASGAGGRLIIVCGLPGSGKTTLAKMLESSLHAVRFCPDEWMAALSVDIYDEDKRAKIEALQWKFGQELLRLGLTVIIEWGTWARSERDAFSRWFEIFQAPTAEEMALFDAALIG